MRGAATFCFLVSNGNDRHVGANTNELPELTMKSSNAALDERAHEPVPIEHVIITKTTTPFKTVTYEAIARYRNVPLHFIQLTDVMDGFVVADEDTGDRVENAEQKMVDHEKVVSALNDPKSNLRKVLRQRLSAFGIKDKNVTYHMAVEDATLTTELPEWQILHDSLSAYVPEALLHGIANNGTQAGPAAETAAVLANVTLETLMDELRLAAKQLGKVVPPKINSIITFILNSAKADPLEPRRVFEGQSSYRAHMPNGLDVPIMRPLIPIDEAEDYISDVERPDQPQSANYLNWMLNVSPRSKIVRDLAAYLGAAAPEADIRRVWTASAQNTFIRRAEPLQNPTIYSFGKTDDRIGRFKILSSGVNKTDASSLTIEPLLDKADALIFQSMKGLSPKQKALRLLHFFAALVDRQTRSRSKHCPIIVVDDGTMTNVIDFCVKLYRRGFVKNYLNRPLFRGIDAVVSDKNVAHFSDSYVDVIKSNTGAQLSTQQIRTAINQILEFRFSYYEPFVSAETQPTKARIGGVDINPDDVTVSFYTSASNDNKFIMDANHAYGAFLAEHQFAAAYGGGDLHAMGAFAKGYRDKKGHHITCVSTFDLLRNETSKGRVPVGMHRWEVYPDITQRRNALYDAADIEVVAWGGYGTIEEDVNSQAWRIIKPETAINKYKIFYAPGIHRDDYDDNINGQMMREMHGDAFVDAMLVNPRAHIDKGYVLATTIDELKKLTLECKARVVAHRHEHGLRPSKAAHRLAKRSRAPA